jgi:hypothetical protein
LSASALFWSVSLFPPVQCSFSQTRSTSAWFCSISLSPRVQLFFALASANPVLFRCHDGFNFS